MKTLTKIALIFGAGALSACVSFSDIDVTRQDQPLEKQAGYSKCEDPNLKDYYDCPGDHMGNSAPNGNYDYPKDENGNPDDYGRLPH